MVKLVESVKMMGEKQNELLADFRLVLGRPASDQLPLNNRMEALEYSAVLVLSYANIVVDAISDIWITIWTGLKRLCMP